MSELWWLSCGICGDPWNAVVKENEAPGGKYATGTIVANYTEGQVIDIDVKITTNHKGWFEFKLCENNNIHQDSDQSCFDKYAIFNPKSMKKFVILNT